MKYKKKPVVVEAIQWNGTTKSMQDIFLEFGQIDTAFLSEEGAKMEIDTLEGKIYASPNDWIIKGVANELYPCKPDIFEKTYELVEEK